MPPRAAALLWVAVLSPLVAALSTMTALSMATLSMATAMSATLTPSSRVMATPGEAAMSGGVGNVESGDTHTSTSAAPPDVRPLPLPPVPMTHLNLNTWAEPFEEDVEPEALDEATWEQTVAHSDRHDLREANRSLALANREKDDELTRLKYDNKMLQMENKLLEAHHRLEAAERALKANETAALKRHMGDLPGPTVQGSSSEFHSPEPETKPKPENNSLEPPTLPDKTPELESKPLVTPQMLFNCDASPVFGGEPSIVLGGVDGFKPGGGGGLGGHPPLNAWAYPSIGCGSLNCS